MLMLASSPSSPRHRGSIEHSVDGGDHRVIGGRAGETGGDAFDVLWRANRRNVRLLREWLDQRRR
jgi:hypothetical protein